MLKLDVTYDTQMNVEDASAGDVLNHSNSSACSLQSSYASECTSLTHRSVYKATVVCMK